MAKESFEMIASEIVGWCKDHECWDNTAIYFNGKCWATWPSWAGETGEKIAEHVYEYANKDPRSYFEFANLETLSMSFEGGLYTILNSYWENEVRLKWFEDFNDLFKRHGYYFEQGDAWNLSIYEN
ncbi:MAG: hypothetical protein IKV48_02645 [Eggerthellaceae bacterium]|nr:hypothetical protein [Eggerthellaceae bacterium]